MYVDMFRSDTVINRSDLKNYSYDNINCSVLPQEPCRLREEFIINVYVFTTVCIFGIFTNTINIIVLFSGKYFLGGVTCTFLRALSIADLITVCLVAPLGISRCVPVRSDWEYSYRQIYEIYIFLPLVNSSACASVWITMVLAVERYIAVNHHLLSQRLWEKRLRARLAIALVCVFALAINFPYFWYRKFNFRSRYPSVTDFGASRDFNIYLWIRMVLMKGVPIVFIIVFNALLVRSVSRANTHRKRLVFPNTSDGRRQRQQVRITAMMVAISVSFLVCHILEPFSHAPVFSAMFGRCTLSTKGYRIQRCVTNTLEIISYSTNIIFYCIFHKQFASSLRRLCGCGRGGKVANSGPCR